MRYEVDVKAFINVTVEAASEEEAAARAVEYVQALSPTKPYSDGYSATAGFVISGGDFDVDGSPDVEEPDSDECATCAASIETRNQPCDECGHVDEDDSDEGTNA